MTRRPLPDRHPGQDAGRTSRKRLRKTNPDAPHPVVRR